MIRRVKLHATNLARRAGCAYKTYDLLADGMPRKFLTQLPANGKLCAMNSSGFSARNLRLLLWQKGIDRKKWAEELAHWAGVDVSKARALLNGEKPSEREMDRIAEANNIEQQDLLGDLVERVNVLAENLKYLLDSLPHGGQRLLAKELGADETTLSRWKSGKGIASGRADRRVKEKLARLREYFGLSSAVDLTVEPLFLSLEPIGSYQRRQWVQERLEAMDSAELDELFPAFKRLLGSD